MAKSKKCSRGENIRTLSRVLKYIAPYRVLVIASVVCAAVSVASQLYIPVLTGDAIDYMIYRNNVNFDGVVQKLITIGIVTVITLLSQYLLSVINNRITYSVSKNLRNEAICKIHTLPLSYLDAHPTGDIVSRVTADVEVFSDGLLMGFTQLLTGLITIIGTLVFMLGVNIPITLVVVVLTPLSLFVAAFIAGHSYKHFQNQTILRGEETAYINEMLEGQRVVQSFGYEKRSLSDFDIINEKLRSASLKAVFFSSLTNPSTRFINSLVYAGVGLCGALSAVGGGITVGQLSVFLSYASQYAKPFNEISGVVTELQNSLACASRVFSLIDADSEIAESQDAEVLSAEGHVCLSDVSFRYIKSRPYRWVES